MGCQILAGFRLDDTRYLYSSYSPHTAIAVHLQDHNPAPLKVYLNPAILAAFLYQFKALSLVYHRQQKGSLGSL